MRLLGVLLCYNDGDFLEDSIRYLLEQNHHLIVWDHGSTDETADIIRQYKNDLLESRYVPREFDFYELYPAMSRHLTDNYSSIYDWISWPDQDEILEGPSRSKPYREWLEDVHASSCNWIQFNNYNYWFTSSDDTAIKSPELASGIILSFPIVRRGFAPGERPPPISAFSITTLRWAIPGQLALICAIIPCARPSKC